MMLIAHLIAFSACQTMAQPPARLDRYDLLLYRDAQGEVHTARSPDGWKRRREEILAGMRNVMGELPGDDHRVLLDVKIEEEVDAGKYVRRLITYQSEKACRTPAYLCIPKDALAGRRKAPAVLCLHPTDNQVGHQVVVGLGGRGGRHYAAELAERGYVTLAPAYPLLANYQPDVKRLGYDSGTMKAIWDNIRGLDLLASLDYVDDARGFAAIGHSLGGHNAIYTAVFDERITVVVSSCGFDSYLDYYGGDEANWRPGRGWCQTRYMPRLADYRGRLEEIPFDFPELLGALAPRRVFVSAPLHDGNFQAVSVDRCAAAARPVYALFHADAQLVIRHPDCGHEFPEAVRKDAYEAIDAVLRKHEK